MNAVKDGGAEIPTISRVKPDDAKLIFTEDIDYRTTGKKSIWGGGYKETAYLLSLGVENPVRGGRWLNLAAGDGRYNTLLLEHADSVIVNDIDISALQKLRKTTPKKYLGELTLGQKVQKNILRQHISEPNPKLHTVAFNLGHNFPLEDKSIDGIFCAGLLHLFPRENLKNISDEMRRILKPGGRYVLEFPADIQRIAKDGHLIIFGDEPNYSVPEAEAFLDELYGKGISVVCPIAQEVVEEFPNANPPFTFHANVLIVQAFKTTGDIKQDTAIAKYIDWANLALALKEDEKQSAKEINFPDKTWPSKEYNKIANFWKEQHKEDYLFRHRLTTPWEHGAGNAGERLESILEDDNPKEQMFIAREKLLKHQNSTDRKLTGFIIFSPEDQSGKITEIFATTDARERKVDMRLILKVEQYFRTLSLVDIKIETSTLDKEFLDTFRKLGYEQDGTVLRKMLD